MSTDPTDWPPCCSHLNPIQRLWDMYWCIWCHQVPPHTCPGAHRWHHPLTHQEHAQTLSGVHADMNEQYTLLSHISCIDKIPITWMSLWSQCWLPFPVHGLMVFIVCCFVFCSKRIIHRLVKIFNCNTLFIEIRCVILVLPELFWAVKNHLHMLS